MYVCSLALLMSKYTNLKTNYQFQLFTFVQILRPRAQVALEMLAHFNTWCIEDNKKPHLSLKKYELSIFVIPGVQMDLEI